MLFSSTEDLSDQLGTVSQILLNQLGADDSEESCGCLIGDCFGQQSLASAWLSVQNNTSIHVSI